MILDKIGNCLRKEINIVVVLRKRNKNAFKHVLRTLLSVLIFNLFYKAVEHLLEGSSDKLKCILKVVFTLTASVLLRRNTQKTMNQKFGDVLCSVPIWNKFT